METQNLNPQPAGGHCHRGDHRGFRFGRVFFVVAIAAAAGFAGKSFAHGPFRQRSGISSALDPAQMDERVERMVKHFAVQVDATPEQKDKLTAVARDMAPLRGKMKAARTRGIDLTAAPTLDRAAIKKLRTEQIALADTSSKRVTQAMADTAEVLTPEQRRKLAERAQKFGERRGWMRG